MNENNVKDASNEVRASEHLEGKTAVEEKFYLAVNDRLMYENKQLKSSVSSLELKCEALSQDVENSFRSLYC
jgi:hypothetical protein